MDLYIVYNWKTLLEIVKEVKAELGSSEVLWFRGQSNADYPLLPSLCRGIDGFSKEKFLFQKFLQLTLRVFPRRTNDWETLFDMQHYGLPTRLLDWSENLGIAAFFAVNYHELDNVDTHVAIYILNPRELNLYSGIERIPFIPDDKDFDYKTIYWEKRPFAPTYPIAIEPIFQNDRILAQKGMFTIHGDNLSEIAELCPKAVKKIILNKTAIPEIVEFLEIANINEQTVFPDMVGIVNYIRKIAEI